MRCHISLGSIIHVILFWMLGYQALTVVMASVPPEYTGLTQVPTSVVLTATVGSSASSSTTRTQSLIMHDAKIDDLGSSSSSFQPSHSGTLTTSASINTSTTTASSGIGQRIIPSTKVAGILAGIIVIITIIVICFIKGHQRSRRQWMSSQPELYPGHRFLHETSSDGPHPPPPQQKHHSRHSRYSSGSSGTMELDVQNSVVPEDRSRSKKHQHQHSSHPPGNRQRHLGNGPTNNNTSSSTNKIRVVDHQPETVDRSKTTSTTLTSSDLGTVLSNQVEHYSPRPTSSLVGIERHRHHRHHPLQPPSLSSQHDELLYSPRYPNLNNPTSPPDTGRQRLDTLIQQRAALLASGNTISDKGVHNELLLLEQEIQVLKTWLDVSSSSSSSPPIIHYHPGGGDPPPYYEV